MPFSTVVAVNGPVEEFNAVMGVFTRNDSVTKVFSCTNGVVNSETLEHGGEIHPDLARALDLSGETDKMYLVTPCGVMKTVTHEELLKFPNWIVQVPDFFKVTSV